MDKYYVAVVTTTYEVEAGSEQEAWDKVSDPDNANGLRVTDQTIDIEEV